MGHRKNTGQHHDHAQAAHEVHIAEGEAQLGIDGAEANGGQQQADTGGHQTLEHIAFGDGQNHGHGHKAQGGVFPGAHLEGKIRDLLRQDATHQGREEGAHEGGSHADGESLAGLTLLGHGMTVPAGGDGGSRAGDAQQHGADEGAGAAADPQRQQENNGGAGVHGVGQGHEQHNRHGTGQAGDGAEQNGSRKHQDQIHGNRKLRKDIRQVFNHGDTPFPINRTAGRRAGSYRTGVHTCRKEHRSQRWRR